MKRITCGSMLASGILAATVVLAGCNSSDEGPAEKAGKQLDQAAGQMQQSIENAAGQTGDKDEESGGKTKNASE